MKIEAFNGREDFIKVFEDLPKEFTSLGGILGEQLDIPINPPHKGTIGCGGVHGLFPIYDGVLEWSKEAGYTFCVFNTSFRVKPTPQSASDFIVLCLRAKEMTWSQFYTTFIKQQY